MQCSGIAARSKTQCQRKTNHPSGTCKYHRPVGALSTEAAVASTTRANPLPVVASSEPAPIAPAVTCGVCLEETSTDIKLTCNHGLCLECATQLRKPSCPTCRATLVVKKDSLFNAKHLKGIKKRERDDTRERIRNAEAASLRLVRQLARQDRQSDMLERVFAMFLGGTFDPNTQMIRIDANYIQGSHYGAADH